MIDSIAYHTYDPLNITKNGASLKVRKRTEGSINPQKLKERKNRNRKCPMLQLQNEEVEKCLAFSSVDLPGQVLPFPSSSRQALSSARQNACVTHDAWF